MLQISGGKIYPLTFVNSSAAVNGVVGEFDGSVCTSANARVMLEWALKQGDAVLFLPDQHLGNNTANSLGIPKEKRVLLPKDVIDGRPGLSVDPTAAENKQLILWPGYCPIHDKFTMDSVRAIRQNDPEAKIVVHPECDPAIVNAADGNGSTTYLIKYADEAPEGSTIYIGTETNLVKRLANLYQGQKTIKPLRTALCEDMGKITVEKLARTLETLESTTPVTVQNNIREPAKLALERMLAACS
jgi:quinolinate synthase